MKLIDVDHGILSDFWVNDLSRQIKDKPSGRAWREFEMTAILDGKDKRQPLSLKAWRAVIEGLRRSSSRFMLTDQRGRGYPGEIKDFLAFSVFHQRK